MSQHPDYSQLPHPYVFVVGCPRSGTTLLQRMLDAHPDMAIANDTHFITRAAKKVLRYDPTPRLTPDLVDSVVAYRRFHRMGLSEAQARSAATGTTSYSDFVGRLYQARSQAAGKPISGEKTPDYCRKLPQLSRLFPASRFIHIIRDGRDTALSALDWANANKGPGKWALWQIDSVGTCALWWKWQVGRGVIDGRALDGDRYHEVRYEDLIDNVDDRLREITDFLGIPYAPEMSRFFQGKTREEPGLSAKSAWIPPTKGLRDWRRQMTREDALVFQGIAGELLEWLGYERLDETPGRAVLDRIDHCLEWWQDNPRSSKNSR